MLAGGYFKFAPCELLACELRLMIAQQNGLDYNMAHQA